MSRSNRLISAHKEEKKIRIARFVDHFIVFMSTRNWRFCRPKEANPCSHFPIPTLFAFHLLVAPNESITSLNVRENSIHSFIFCSPFQLCVSVSLIGPKLVSLLFALFWKPLGNQTSLSTFEQFFFGCALNFSCSSSSSSGDWIWTWWNMELKNEWNAN